MPSILMYVHGNTLHASPGSKKSKLEKIHFNMLLLCENKIIIIRKIRPEVFGYPYFMNLKYIYLGEIGYHKTKGQRFFFNFYKKHTLTFSKNHVRQIEPLIIIYLNTSNNSIQGSYVWTPFFKSIVWTRFLGVQEVFWYPVIIIII